MSIVYNDFQLRLKIFFSKKNILVFIIRTFKNFLLKYTRICIIFQQVFLGIYLLEIPKFVAEIFFLVFLRIY